MSTAETTTDTPYGLIGGAGSVSRVVDRFYDLMDSDPRYAQLRALHAPDLTPMRKSLAGFLNGWLGGPRDWFEANPGKCMMSLHGKVAVSAETAEQWGHAMGRALADAGIEPGLATKINEAFARMAMGMVR